jgi:DNA-binding PadR family transcriptional regulator
MKKPNDVSAGSRNPSVVYLILSSLADGEKHGYALTKDVETFAGVRIAPGSLYEALARLEAQGLVEPVASTDRRRPYRLTGAGAKSLSQYVTAQERLIDEARRRLQRSRRFA